MQQHIYTFVENDAVVRIQTVCMLYIMTLHKDVLGVTKNETDATNL